MRIDVYLVLVAILLLQQTEGVRLEAQAQRKKRNRGGGGKMFSNFTGLGANMLSTFVPGVSDQVNAATSVVSAVEDGVNGDANLMETLKTSTGEVLGAAGAGDTA